MLSSFTSSCDSARAFGEAFWFMKSLVSHSRSFPWLIPRAVANGPVGPAMAGPIIEPAIKKNINFFNFLIFIFLLVLVGIINETVFF